MNREARLETAISAAVAAGDILIRHYHEKVNATSKESLRDIVTEIDRMAESCIIDIISRVQGNESIIAEERGVVMGSGENGFWLIDALDGTVNFVNHIPFFCVSIAYVENHQPILGAIYNPMAGDLYYGAEGIGVFKNQRAIKVKNRPAHECLYSVAFSGKNYDPERRRHEFCLMAEINDSSRGCLRTGSAAMNLAFLAEGRLGGCWGKANKFWDIAGGLVLAKLAGASLLYSCVDPERMLVSYLASNPYAWESLKRQVGPFLGVDDFRKNDTMP
jgi:myo-inositol-1(or 4)-monophosphatase